MRKVIVGRESIGWREALARAAALASGLMMAVGGGVPARRRSGDTERRRDNRGRFNDGFDEVRLERAQGRRLRMRARPQGGPRGR